MPDQCQAGQLVQYKIANFLLISSKKHQRASLDLKTAEKLTCRPTLLPPGCRRELQRMCHTVKTAMTCRRTAQQRNGGQGDGIFKNGPVVYPTNAIHSRLQDDH